MIRNAVIIKDTGEVSTVVTLGKTVTFKELPNGDEEAYTIVGSAEADPFEGRISNDSPIAKSLLGKQIGEKVTIQTPGGEMQVEIVSVNKKDSPIGRIFLSRYLPGSKTTISNFSGSKEVRWASDCS